MLVITPLLLLNNLTISLYVEIYQQMGGIMEDLQSLGKKD